MFAAYLPLALLLTALFLLGWSRAGAEQSPIRSQHKTIRLLLGATSLFFMALLLVLWAMSIASLESSMRLLPSLGVFMLCGTMLATGFYLFRRLTPESPRGHEESSP